MDSGTLSGLGRVITLLRAKGCVLGLLPSVLGQTELQNATPQQLTLRPLESFLPLEQTSSIKRFADFFK